jgi:hypothetical protein
VLEDHCGDDDAGEMAGAFGGRHWSELSSDEVLYHRGPIFTWSAAGYLSYLPAYVVRCLRDDPDLVVEVGAFVVFALRSRRGRRSTQQRLAWLDDDQWAAVAAVLRHVAVTWADEGAERLLADWPGAPIRPAGRPGGA